MSSRPLNSDTEVLEVPGIAFKIGRFESLNDRLGNLDQIREQILNERFFSVISVPLW
jgi:hypothetical protein